MTTSGQNQVPTYYLPEHPYSPIDALNRRAAALGSPQYAQMTAGADYNGHQISVTWNDYRGYYITQYYYGERVVLARGDFESCLKSAINEYNRGALGCAVQVYPREDDTEAQAICEASQDLIKGHLNDSDRSWYTWRHTCAARSVRDYANPHALRMNFDWELLQSSEDEAAYEKALIDKFGKVYTF